MDFLSAELGFDFHKPVHDAAFTQLYIDCVAGDHKLIYGYDEWFEGFLFLPGMKRVIHLFKPSMIGLKNRTKPCECCKVMR